MGSAESALAAEPVQRLFRVTRDTGYFLRIVKRARLRNFRWSRYVIEAPAVAEDLEKIGIMNDL